MEESSFAGFGCLLMMPTLRPWQQVNRYTLFFIQGAHKMLQQHELCFIRRRDGPCHGNACCIRTDRFQSKRHVSLLLASFHALRLSLRRLGILGSLGILGGTGDKIRW